jgi:trans-aconitate methyltransferase
MAAHYLAGKSDVRILSFGCSTGEEVYSLGSYFPTSQITGVDINEWCIRQCRKKYLDKQFSFFHTFSSEFASSEPFDAIFCMAVFQRSEKNELTDGSYLLEFTFSQFESELVKLGSNLKPGGLLVIDHCDFNFQDTKCAINYAPLPFEKNQLLRNRPLFDKYNRKIADRQNNYRMFKKK